MNKLLFKDNSFNYIGWTIFCVILHLNVIFYDVNLFDFGLLYPMRIILPLLGFYLLIQGKIFRPYNKVQINIFIFFTYLLVYGILSVAWTLNANKVFETLGNYIFGFLMVYIIMEETTDIDKFENLILINMALLFILMFMGIYESATGDYLFSDRWHGVHPIKGWDTYYPVVSFDNPNDFIFVLFAFMPFINAVTKNVFVNKLKYVGVAIRFVYFILYIILAALASCRMGLLLVPFSCVINVFFTMNKKYRLIYLVVAAITLAILLTTLNLDVGEGGLDSSPRIKLWKNVLLNLEYFHFMGTGPGNSFIKIEGLNYFGALSNPHNTFVEILGDFGIISFIIFIVCYIISFIYGCKSYNKQKNNKQLKEINGSSLKFLIYFIPMSIMCSSVLDSLQFWFIVGIVIIGLFLKENSLIDIKEINNNYKYIV